MKTVNMLTERVTLQSPVLTKNNSGGHTTVWVTLLDVWARVEAKTLSLSFIAEQREVSHRYAVTLRNILPLSEEMRLLWQGKILRIVGLMPPKQGALYRIVECTDTTAGE